MFKIEFPDRPQALASTPREALAMAWIALRTGAAYVTIKDGRHIFAATGSLSVLESAEGFDLAVRMAFTDGEQSSGSECPYKVPHRIAAWQAGRESVR